MILISVRFISDVVDQVHLRTRRLKQVRAREGTDERGVHVCVGGLTV